MEDSVLLQAALPASGAVQLALLHGSTQLQPKCPRHFQRVDWSVEVRALSVCVPDSAYGEREADSPVWTGKISFLY
jgi:hypothetical protein